MEYASIPKLAITAKVSDKAIRRYKERFPEFFSPTIIDGVKKYPCERTLEMIARIKSLYENGSNRQEVRKILDSEFEDLFVPMNVQAANIAPKKVSYKKTVDLNLIKDLIKEVLNEFSEMTLENNELKQKVKDLEEKLNEQSTVIEELRELREIVMTMKKPEKTTATPYKKEPSDYKTQIAKQVIDLKNSGLTLTEISAKFNKEKVKTLSGTGKWNPGTLSKLCRYFD